MVTDRDLLEKFKKVMRISNRISKEDVAKMMKITQDQLLEKLFEWGDELAFKIESDEIVIDDISNFTDGIDAMFEDWEDKETRGFGKVSNININASDDLIVETNNREQKPLIKSSSPLPISQAKMEINTGFYNGFELQASQVECLKEIESLIGGQSIPYVDKIEYNTFGFNNDGFEVVGLGLYKTGLRMLPKSLKKMKKIQDLNLGRNDLKTLPKSIGLLKNLQRLNLRSNQLTSLPESIGSLKNLQRLNLRSNQLTSLPESIGSLKNLQKLWLYKNQLRNLPETIINLNNLQELYIYKNNLTNLPVVVKKWLKTLKKNKCTIKL